MTGFTSLAVAGKEGPIKPSDLLHELSVPPDMLFVLRQSLGPAKARTDLERITPLSASKRRRAGPSADVDHIWPVLAEIGDGASPWDLGHCPIRGHEP